MFVSFIREMIKCENAVILSYLDIKEVKLYFKHSVLFVNAV